MTHLIRLYVYDAINGVVCVCVCVSAERCVFFCWAICSNWSARMTGLSSMGQQKGILFQRWRKSFRCCNN